MKRYKLKRDLPTFKAGDVFYISDTGNLLRESDNVPAYSWSTIDKFPNILTDWFEEINESTRWKPERLQNYYYVGGDSFIYSDNWANGSAIDNGRFEIGNCFQTKEEAEQVVEYLKALATVRGDATTKFVGGGSNWFVYFDTDSKSLGSTCIFYISSKGIFGLPYFATREDAQRSIERHKNEWLTIFGIKEEECD